MTRGAKRAKLADTQSQTEPGSIEVEVKRIIDAIHACVRSRADQIDKLRLRKLAHQLAEYCKTDDLVDTIVGHGAIKAVVPLLFLTDFPIAKQAALSFDDVEKEACFILGLLAVKPEHQQQIVVAGALPGLVRLLKQHRATGPGAARSAGSAPGAAGSGGAAGGTGSGSARRAADAITNLAHENVDIKNLVRGEGGIQPLVALLESWDVKVQRASAGALRTLAFKNEENKNVIVECGALTTLVRLLRSEDVGVHYEAVGVIGNLVHSSQNIKRRVLEEGALQPVINLLSSTCPESQREAALLLGQFATTDAEHKSKIVQRGAVPPLIRMLSAPDIALKEMAAFALGRLAQNGDNQAGISAQGGLRPLLALLESSHYNLQHNAAFALYGLSDNEDNIPDLLRVGGLQRLLECGERLQVQASKDCVQKTITRIEQKLASPRVLAHVTYMLRSPDRAVQRAVAMSLARLAPSSQLKAVFVEQAGLDVLLGTLTASDVDTATQRQAAEALLELVTTVNATAPIDAGPQQPQRSVYLGGEYVNSRTLADVTFVVEGREFHAHRIALLASSDAFRAMFEGGYREKEASRIEIPNIPYDVFSAMMHYIYTGNCSVAADIAQPLLQASDQYLLEGLKRLCEASIAQALSLDTLTEVYTLSEAFSAPQLGKRCVLYALQHYTELAGSSSPDFMLELMGRMVPLLRSQLVDDLSMVPAGETQGGNDGDAEGAGAE